MTILTETEPDVNPATSSRPDDDGVCLFVPSEPIPYGPLWLIPDDHPKFYFAARLRWVCLLPQHESEAK